MSKKYEYFWKLTSPPLRLMKRSIVCVDHTLAIRRNRNEFTFYTSTKKIIYSNYNNNKYEYQRVVSVRYVRCFLRNWTYTSGPRGNDVRHTRAGDVRERQRKYGATSWQTYFINRPAYIYRKTRPLTTTVFGTAIETTILQPYTPDFTPLSTRYRSFTRPVSATFNHDPRVS